MKNRGNSHFSLQEHVLNADQVAGVGGRVGVRDLRRRQIDGVAGVIHQESAQLLRGGLATPHAHPSLAPSLAVDHAVGLHVDAENAPQKLPLRRRRCG